MQADTLSMLRVVQIPPMDPLPEGGLITTTTPSQVQGIPAAPAATCVLVPLPAQPGGLSDGFQGSPLRLQTLGDNVMFNNNNNNNNDSSNKNNNKLPITKMYKKIQPATPEMTRCKRKINFVNGQAVSQKKAASVARRNERERNRVKQVNQGFERLRQHVPNGARNKKMSKVDTLRSALEYIQFMKDLLEQSDDPANNNNNDNNGVNNNNNMDYEPTPEQMLGHLQMPHTDALQPVPHPHHQPQTNLEFLNSDNMSPANSVESSLPSPSYSTDSYSQRPQHPMYTTDSLEQAPLSPEQNELLDLATVWLMQSS